MGYKVKSFKKSYNFYVKNMPYIQELLYKIVVSTNGRVTQISKLKHVGIKVNPHYIVELKESLMYVFAENMRECLPYIAFKVSRQYPITYPLKAIEFDKQQCQYYLELLDKFLIKGDAINKG